MTEQCKVCEKEYGVVNMAHIKTHQMTREDYDNYDTTVEPVEPETTVEPIWNSLDISSIQFKTKRIRLLNHEVLLNNKMNVMVHDRRDCPTCLKKIYEPVAYVLLRSRLEIQARRLEKQQYVMHKLCAIASGDIRNVLASVYIAGL